MLAYIHIFAALAVVAILLILNSKIQVHIGKYFLLPIGLLSCTNIPKSTQKIPLIHQAVLEFEIQSDLGEGAIWNHDTQELYWVDILGRKVHVYNPQTKKNKAYPTPQAVGTVVPADSIYAIVGLADGAYMLDTRSGEIDLISYIEKDLGSTRLNDGKCDPVGRFWVGSMDYDLVNPIGGLYRVQSDGTVHKALDRITISNGIVWSSDHKKMYYIDTPTGYIQSFDFNSEDGSISNQKVAVKIPDSLGQPDGMTIDEEDKLWVGMWNGNIVARFDPNSGTLMAKIEVPAHNVTSCAFGGPDLDILYITTSGIDMNEEERERFPLAGSLFKAVPGVKGVKSSFFKYSPE